jgi:hypothetical protein
LTFSIVVVVVVVAAVDFVFVVCNIRDGKRVNTVAVNVTLEIKGGS